MERQRYFSLLLLAAIATVTAADLTVSEQPRKSPIQFCSSNDAYDPSEGRLCFDMQVAFDTIHSKFDQYPYHSTPDYRQKINGASFSGMTELHLNYENQSSYFHLGLVYFPKADEPKNDLSRRAPSERNALYVDEAYVMLMPLDWVPLSIQVGSTYTPFSDAALNMPMKWTDYPLASNPTFLLTESLADTITLTYDDVLNSGFKTSWYLQSSSQTLDKSGDMEAWGASFSYLLPKFFNDQAQASLGFSFVSDGLGARYIVDNSSQKHNPAYAFHFYSKMKNLSIEFSNVRLNFGDKWKPSATDIALNYYLDSDKRYVTAGWSMTTSTSALNLPENSWWLGMSQQVNETIALYGLAKRQNAYADSPSDGLSDMLYALRVTLDLF